MTVAARIGRMNVRTKLAASFTRPAHEVALAVLLVGLMAAAGAAMPNFVNLESQLFLSRHLWETAILALGMTLSVVFVLVLVYTGWAPAHAGIAAATACSAFVNAGLLLAGLRRQGVYRPRAGWGALAWRVALPTLVMALALGGGLEFAGDWYLMSTGQRIGALVAAALSSC